MKTGDIGEMGLLSLIRDFTRMAKGAKLGFDEDASDIPLSDSHSVVLNIDTFVAGTDFLPGMTWAQAGRKTAVMALSDVLAKGGRPVASMLSLCAPEDTPSDDVVEAVRGFSQYCLKSDVSFIGGDLGMASEIVLSGVAVSIMNPRHMLKRGGAQKGDIIAVSRRFGLTSVAYQILLGGLQTDDDALHKRALSEAYRPELSLSLIPSLAEAGLLTSCMDSSDGLGKTLNTMSDQSGMMFRIDRLPSAAGVEIFARMHFMDEMKLVMQGGEEFIPVMTLPQNNWDAACDLAKGCGDSLFEIGKAVDSGKGVFYESPEGYVPVPADGYDNFREWN
jgi:thiamine-monophosphate kinase